MKIYVWINGEMGLKDRLKQKIANAGSLAKNEEFEKKLKTVQWLQENIAPLNEGRFYTKMKGAKSNCTLLAEKCVRVLSGLEKPTRVAAVKNNLNVVIRKDDSNRIVYHEVYRQQQSILVPPSEFVETINLLESEKTLTHIDLSQSSTKEESLKYIASTLNTIAEDLKNLPGDAQSSGTDKTLTGLIYYYFHNNKMTGHLANFYRSKEGDVYFVDAQTEEIDDSAPQLYLDEPFADEVFYYALPPSSGYYIKKEPGLLKIKSESGIVHETISLNLPNEEHNSMNDQEKLLSNANNDNNIALNEEMSQTKKRKNLPKRNTGGKKPKYLADLINETVLTEDENESSDNNNNYAFFGFQPKSESLHENKGKVVSSLILKNNFEKFKKLCERDPSILFESHSYMAGINLRVQTSLLNFCFQNSTKLSFLFVETILSYIKIVDQETLNELIPKLKISDCLKMLKKSTPTTTALISQIAGVYKDPRINENNKLRLLSEVAINRDIKALKFLFDKNTGFVWNPKQYDELLVNLVKSFTLYDCIKDTLEIINFIKKSYQNGSDSLYNEPLFIALKKNLSPDITLSLIREQNIDHLDESGNCALMLAVSTGKIANVKALLKNKADPNLPISININGEQISSILDYAKKTSAADNIISLIAKKCEEINNIKTHDPTFSQSLKI